VLKCEPRKPYTLLARVRAAFHDDCGSTEFKAPESLEDRVLMLRQTELPIDSIPALCVLFRISSDVSQALARQLRNSPKRAIRVVIVDPDMTWNVGSACEPDGFQTGQSSATNCVFRRPLWSDALRAG
jgi:hypothetical protein